MKRSLIIVPLLVGMLALVMLFVGGDGREFTTTSAEAYAAFEDGYRHSISLQVAQAESSLTRAVTLDGDFAMARALLAGIYARTGRTAEMETQVRLADSLAALLPNDVERAKVQLQLSGLKDMGGGARRDSLLAFLMEEEPDNVQVLYAKATVLFAERDPAVDAAFQRILELEPNYAPVYNMLGYLEARRGDYEAALGHLHKYAFLAPDLANPHDSLGEILNWMGEYEQAEREYATALKIDPEFHFSLMGLANVYLDQGMLAKGRSILDKLRTVVAGTQVESEIDRVLIRTLYTFGLHEESLALMRRFVADNPDDFLVGFYHALLLALEGDTAAGDARLAAFMADARAKLSKAGNERALARIESLRSQYDAMAARLAGDHRAAADAWAAVVAAYPEDEMAPHEVWWLRWREGEERLAAGQPRRALELAMASLDPNPNRIPPLLLVARAALALDERTMARSALNQAAPLLARADADLPAQATFRELTGRLAALSAQ